MFSNHSDSLYTFQFQIIEGGKKGESLSYDECLSIFLVYMSESVLDACGISYSKIKDRTVLSEAAIDDFSKKVREARNIILVCKAWFGILLHSRDLVLGNSANRFGFSSDILWAGNL